MGRHDALDVVRLVQEHDLCVALALRERGEDGGRVVPPISVGDHSTDVPLLFDARGGVRDQQCSCQEGRNER